MIEAMREWLTSVIAAALLTSLAQSLTPEGTVRKIAGFVSGLILLVVLTRPFLGGKLDLSGLRYADYAGEIQRRQTALSEENARTMEALIAEKCQAYILKKAEEMQIRCTVRVSVETGEDGVPAPVGAEVTGRGAQALAAYIEREMGIPRERQVYHETG